MYTASFRKYTLEFIRPARTSRSEMKTHEVYYIRLERLADGKTTYGEAAPLKGLSTDDVPGFARKLQECCDRISEGAWPEAAELETFPSIAFALETARAAMLHTEDFKVFDTSFYAGEPILINGLVWMNDAGTMLEEALEKARKGFDTIKFKVGALDFDEECRMLETFRKHYQAHRIELRLDANGAFKPDEALKQLRELQRFGIHSIEQPLKAGQWDAMQELCARSPVAIALDEELIGVNVHTDAARMLRHISPAYLILKPTLTGGFARSDAWISEAKKLGIGWWATSALESNIGLNAIAQWTSTHQNPLPQGLGTGSLYRNNISSPLIVNGGKIKYAGALWNMHAINQLFD